jgi:polysaccharide biosynthesis protein PslH
MVPRPQAPGAIPLVLDAMLEGLRARHDVSLVCIVQTPESEADAICDLRDRGIDVHVVVSESGDQRKRWQRRWRLASTWFGGATPFRGAWFFEPGVQRTIDQLCRTRSFDLVSLEDNATGLYQVPAGLPVVLTEYEVRRPRSIDWESAIRGRGRRWWLFRELDWQRWPAYQRRVWRRANLLQVLTARDAEAVSAIAPDVSSRVRVNPFGVRLADQPVDFNREDPNTLLFVGNFTHPPNVDAAFWLVKEIMPRIRSRCPSVRLVLVGPDPPSDVRALAGDAVEVTGRVQAIEPFFEQSALLLAPLRTGGGQRMKVLQAMALGKAVVTTPRGAEGLEMDGLCPPLAVADTAESLADTSVRLLSDAHARHAMAADARAYAVAHFGPDAYASRLERVYHELVG